MAEIIGVIATILQLIDTAVKAHDYLKGFRNATQEQQRLLSEIQSVDALAKQLHLRMKQTLERLTKKLSSTENSNSPQEEDHELRTESGAAHSRDARVPNGVHEELGTPSRIDHHARVPFGRSSIAQLSWPLWGKDEVYEGLDTIERFKSFLNLWLGMSIWDCTQEISSTVKDIAEEQRIKHEYISAAVRDSTEKQRISHNYIYESVTHVSQTQEMYHPSAELERDKILDWFSPINSFLRQADISSMQQSGTGTWLLQNDKIKLWKLGKQRTVWCRGMPGAGKTVLASMVIDDLCANLESQRTGVAVVYLNHKETEIQTPSNLLAALWRQLTFGRPLSTAVHELYVKHHEQRTRPSLEDVSSVLCSTVSELSGVFLVIDALDEYPETQRDLLLRYLSALPSTHVIADSETLEIRASEDDIRRYVDAQIMKSPRLCTHIINRPELRDEIDSMIVQRSGGMFLLAKLHIDSLTTKHTVKAVRECLMNMPSDLNRTYDERGRQELAQRALSWIANAKRLLRPSELRVALAVEPGTTELDLDNFLDLDTILSVCEGLVIFNAEDDRVCLIHYTAQSYLNSIQARDFPHAQSQITTTCITYLLFDAFSPHLHSTLDNALFLPTPSTHHLLNYALNYGLVHARGQPEFDSKDLILAFLARRSTWLSLWNRVYYYNKIPELATKLWIAAFFDLRQIAGHLLIEEGPDAGAIYAASVNRHADMVGMLTGAGVQVNALGGYHGTALQVAALAGDENMARLLIRSGADVNIQTKRHNNALYEASRRGYEAIVRLLIDNGADVNIQTEEHGTALQMASHGGHQEIVRLLLANGADVNTQSKEQLSGTALQMASIEGHQEIIRMLIENGAHVNFQTKERGSALYGASLMQNDEAVALLIEHGADVDAKGPDGTALQVAAADGNEKIVRLLLANGANVNTEGPNGTALQAAMSEGHDNIVHLLVEHGAGLKKYSSPKISSRFQEYGDFAHLLIKHAVPPSSWHQSGNLLFKPQKLVQYRRTSWS
ncbi:ankyrin repeat-containing domain protein [Mycena capillaripes]|nr:ankyrin repeat-containing domain protein [Mycena capillaripes]